MNEYTRYICIPDNQEPGEILLHKQKSDMPAVKKDTAHWFKSERQFDQLYPTHIQELAPSHWTPLHVAKKASHFLAAEKNARILDIGSGVGKFCLSAAFFEPDVQFFGVEQRHNLVKYAEKVREILCLRNVSFLYKNVTAIDFEDYDHFYFYNSFYENLDNTNKIDSTIDYSQALFNYYSIFLLRKLESKPAGTRLVTYHSQGYEVPEGYLLVRDEMDGQLKFWIKI